jgi:hypothetical protein
MSRGRFRGINRVVDVFQGASSFPPGTPIRIPRRVLELDLTFNAPLRTLLPPSVNLSWKLCDPRQIWRGEKPSKYRYSSNHSTAKFGIRFNQKVLIDPTPMPDHIPKVEEIGASSAPLMSASYFIGARCRPYNDDYMQCKTEAYGRGEVECMKEGRKVTRCAASVYEPSYCSG